MSLDADLQTIIEAPISAPTPADGVLRVRVAIRLGLPADKDLGYAISDHDPALGLTRDSYRVRRASTLPLLLGAPEGSCLS